ncbi:MAG: TfoX/Sxy family protein [Myxococcota bacterium]
MASGFVAYLLDLLVGDVTDGLGRPSVRAMFGGHGLYLGERMVGLVAADVLYLKTDAKTRPEFEAAGSRPFEYHSAGREKPAVMSYWEAPADALEDVDALRHWLELAHGAALRAAAARPKARPRKPSGRRR